MCLYMFIWIYIYGPSCSKSLHTVIQTVIDPESRWIFPYRQSINYLVGIKTQHCAQIILQTVHSLKLPQRHGHEPCRQLLNCDEDTIPAGARNKVYVLSPLALSMHRGMSERHFLAAVRRQRDFRLAHGITAVYSKLSFCPDKCRYEGILSSHSGILMSFSSDLTVLEGRHTSDMWQTLTNCLLLTMNSRSPHGPSTGTALSNTVSLADMHDPSDRITMQLQPNTQQ